MDLVRRAHCCVVSRTTAQLTCGNLIFFSNISEGSSRHEARSPDAGIGRVERVGQGETRPGNSAPRGVVVVVVVLAFTRIIKSVVTGQP